MEIPPTATAQTVTDIAPHPVGITLTGSSLQGSALTFTVTGNPAHGTLSGTAPNLVYTPHIAGGTDSFSFVANDGVDDSAPATVTITVVTPSLASTICTPGAAITIDQEACASPLTSVSNGQGGTVQLAHTDGAANSELKLQVTIRNQTSVPDTVTITAPAGTSGWDYLYDLAGQDVTSAITTTGVVVTLGPNFTLSSAAYLQVITFDPPEFSTVPATSSFTITATSGNDPSVSTSLPVEVQDGTSTPTLSLSQSDGSGTVVFPGSLALTPPLYAGGPAGQVLIDPAIKGTGENTFRVSATANVGSTSAVTPQYFLGTTNVTSAVEAGTEVIQCYAELIAFGSTGCPPMHVVLTGSSTGAGAGFWSTQIMLTSTIDGSEAFAFLNARLAASVGPDFYTYQPNQGISVFEPTPVTQVASVPTELSGSASKTVYLYNQGDISDTFKVKAAVTLAPGDTSHITVTATPPGDLGDPGPPADATAALTNGTYTVTLPSGDGVLLSVTDTSGANTTSAPAAVVLTATSELDPAKVDSFGLTFPTYSYRPDAVLTGANGQSIGAGIYQQTYPGPVGNKQQDEYDVDQSTPATVPVTFTDQGSGPAPSGDKVVVTAPATDPNFVITYALTYLGTTTDVTSAIEGAGVPLTLRPAPAPMPVITMTAVASLTAQAGHPGYFPMTVTSQSSLPTPLADVVVIGLYNTGESQLRFGGLPQPEPADITTTVNQNGQGNRVAPFPSVGYAPGAYYGAYSDSTGQKFAYVSAYDTFDLQVASEKVSHTAYRIQMVDPGLSLNGLPNWEKIAFDFPYYNGHLLETPADPMAAGSGLNPIITAGGQNITAAVEAGTYTTASLGTNQTSNITISFNPTGGDSQRYIPLKFNLINASTGATEDVMVIDPSSIITCSSDGYSQQQAVITGPNGPERLNFEAFNRLNPNDPSSCMQHLSHSWITTAPVVFSSYVAATDNTLAGGNTPTGLWLMPQSNTIVRIDTDTLTVTSPYVKAFVDSPIVDADGSPDPSAAAAGILNSYFLGNFPNLTWNTTDGTNGIEVTSTTLPPSPFPLVAPSTSDWPNNTMAAARYFQVDSVTGDPVMVGEMDVHVPWFSGDVPLIMPVDSTNGLTLDYAVPADTSVPLPGLHTASFYNFYFTSNNDGTVVQGGCLGLPSELFVYLGLGGGPNICILGATVTFMPISATPGVEAKVSQITVQLINPGIGVKGSPEFNLNSFSGEIDFDPASQEVTKVVLDPDFGVGPPTGCQEDQNLGIIDDATGHSGAPRLPPLPHQLLLLQRHADLPAGRVRQLDHRLRAPVQRHPDLPERHHPGQRRGRHLDQPVQLPLRRQSDRPLHQSQYPRQRPAHLLGRRRGRRLRHRRVGRALRRRGGSCRGVGGALHPRPRRVWDLSPGSAWASAKTGDRRRRSMPPAVRPASTRWAPDVARRLKVAGAGLALLILMAGCNLASKVVVQPDGSGSYSVILTVPDASSNPGQALYQAVLKGSAKSDVPLKVTPYSSGGTSGAMTTFHFLSLADLNAESARLAASGGGDIGVTINRDSTGWHFARLPPRRHCMSPPGSAGNGTEAPPPAVRPVEAINGSALSSLLSIAIVVQLPGAPAQNNAKAVTHTASTSTFTWALSPGQAGTGLQAATTFVGNQGSVKLSSALTSVRAHAAGDSVKSAGKGSSSGLEVGLITGGALLLVALGAIVLARRSIGA